MKRVCRFIFKRGFYTLSYTFPEVKDTKSCRISSTFHQFYLHRNQDLFGITFHKQVSYVTYIIFWPCGLFNILWLFLDKSWSNWKLAFPLSFQSIVPLRKQSYILKEQKCSGLQQRKYLLTQGSYVANTKATACFSCIPTILANALPHANWQRTRKLGRKHWLNNAVLF